MHRQAVSLKNICYPFSAYYDSYKDDKTIDSQYINKAKEVGIE